MILQRQSRSVSQRSAFTLLEILVVVAIILVLASVATVSIMSYLEDAKYDKTRINLKAAEKALATAILKNGGDMPDDPIGSAARYIDGGADSLKDGFGNQIQLEMAADPATGNQRPRAHTSTPRGEMSSWDK